MSQAQLILAALANQVNTASVNTVVNANAKLDMTVRTLAEVPLNEIIAVEETTRGEVGGFDMYSFFVDLTCYYIDEPDSDTQKETLTKELKDAIGGDITLNGTCTCCHVRSVRYGGEFPLWEVILSLEILYEKEIANA